MPTTFDNLGISFQYPDNWQLDEAEVRAGQSAVTVFSPGGAFWSVAIHSSSTDPERTVQAAMNALRREYDSLEAEEISQTINGHALHGFDLNFFCLDLTNTATIRSTKVNGVTYTIYCQAEDREYATIQRVFEAMTLTLLRSLSG